MKANTIGRKIDLFPYILILPAVIMLLALTVYPFASSILISLTDFNFLKVGSEYIGTSNYTSIIKEGKFFNALIFTVLWTVTNLVLMSILGFASMLLMRLKFIGNRFLKATILIPWILPQVVTGYIWTLMLSQNIGIVNSFLSALHIVPKDFSWFSSGTGSFWAVVIANSWRGFPFFAIMLYAKLQTIPISWIEAARIDGANPFQIFWNISLNYIKPVYINCMILAFIWTFNAFDIIKVMTNGGPLEKTISLSLLLQRESFDYMEVSRASTMAVLMFVSILAILVLIYGLSKIFIRRKEA